MKNRLRRERRYIHCSEGLATRGAEDPSKRVCWIRPGRLEAAMVKVLCVWLTKCSVGGKGGIGYDGVYLRRLFIPFTGRGSRPRIKKVLLSTHHMLYIGNESVSYKNYFRPRDYFSSSAGGSITI